MPKNSLVLAIITTADSFRILLFRKWGKRAIPKSQTVHGALAIPREGCYVIPVGRVQLSAPCISQNKKDHTPLMSTQHPNDPLHGVTLEQILNRLVEHYGWEELGEMIDIRCFNSDPSVKSSLKFLRRTPWARKKVEDLYIYMLMQKDGEKNSN